MKRIFTLIAVTLAGFSLVACSDQKARTKYYDSDFISALENGLQKRWAITDNVKSTDKTSEDTLTKSLNAELKVVKPYENKKFKDNKLHEQALTYINALDDQKTALNSYDKFSFFNKWNKAYNTRTKMIVQINQKHKLKVADKYKNDLTELTRNGDAVTTENKKTEAVNTLLKSIKFKQTKDDGYTYTYDAKVKNSSGYSFKNFSIKVKLMDSKKTTIDTQYVSANDWGKEQTNQFEFMTNKKFSSYKVILDYTD
ncbi:FxLYD domain-containing protein [Levilactobacillus enshiensis]|uniref:FxLYD domain-containing protein n=1 Tax=Levilactobacillus enshiensis TaxID=2590213 RepID=UPI00117B8995|nr:FxLYD domain-containing protein [Levilactobacillus enshiensis]